MNRTTCWLIAGVFCWGVTATVAEDDLGEEFFAEFMGDFWPMVEARPYMRCIKQLAEVLCKLIMNI